MRCLTARWPHRGALLALAYHEAAWMRAALRFVLEGIMAGAGFSGIHAELSPVRRGMRGL